MLITYQMNTPNVYSCICIFLRVWFLRLYKRPNNTSYQVTCVTTSLCPMLVFVLVEWKSCRLHGFLTLTTDTHINVWTNGRYFTDKIAFFWSILIKVTLMFVPGVQLTFGQLCLRQWINSEFVMVIRPPSVKSHVQWNWQMLFSVILPYVLLHTVNIKEV